MPPLLAKVYPQRLSWLKSQTLVRAPRNGAQRKKKGLPWRLCGQGGPSDREKLVPPVLG
jgi:hypothetical protein